MNRRLVGPRHPKASVDPIAADLNEASPTAACERNVAAEIDVLPSNETALRRWRMICPADWFSLNVKRETSFVKSLGRATGVLFNGTLPTSPPLPHQ